MRSSAGRRSSLEIVRLRSNLGNVSVTNLTCCEGETKVAHIIDAFSEVPIVVIYFNGGFSGNLNAEFICSSTGSEPDWEHELLLRTGWTN